jgi:hypothetical protein
VGVAPALGMGVDSLAVAAGLAIIFVYALASLSLPLGWDHGFMSSVGEIMARGGVLYKDAWEIKGPLAYVPFALADLIFGEVMWGIRVVDLAIVGGLLYVLHRLLRVQTSFLVSALACITLYLWFASAGWFFTAQPEIWVALTIAVAVGLLFPLDTSATPKPATFALIGALIACTGLVKPFFMIFGLAPLAFLAVAFDITFTRRFQLACFLAAGAAAPLIGVFAYFAAVGGLGALFEIQVEYNLGTYAGIGYSLSPGFVLDSFKAFFTQGVVTIQLPFAAAGLWMLRTRPKLFAPLLTWLFTALVCVVAQGKFYTYHWFLLYPPLTVCAAFGVHAVWVSAADAPATKMAVGAAALFFTALAAEPPLRAAGGALAQAAGLREGSFHDRFVYLNYRAGDQSAAARHIRERTSPDEGVFVWGNDATVRFLSDRPNPSRFTYSMPLSIEGSLREQYREALMIELASAPPTYIVVGMPWRATVTKAQDLADFPELETYIAESYVLEASIGFLDLYRRSAQTSPAAAGAAR